MAKAEYKTKKHKLRKLIIISIVVAVLLLADILFIGNITYAVKWVQCGARPVVLNAPPQISEGSYPPTYHARTSPNWFRAKQPLIIDSRVSLHCSIDEIYAMLGDNDDVKVEVCDGDNVYSALRIFGDSCE